MQLDERKAEPGVRQVTPQLLLPGESVATSSAPINNDAQQALRRESRWGGLGSWLAANPKVAFGLGIARAACPDGLDATARVCGSGPCQWGDLAAHHLR